MTRSNGRLSGVDECKMALRVRSVMVGLILNRLDRRAVGHSAADIVATRNRFAAEGRRRTAHARHTPPYFCCGGMRRS